MMTIQAERQGTAIEQRIPARLYEPSSASSKWSVRVVQFRAKMALTFWVDKRSVTGRYLTRVTPSLGWVPLQIVERDIVGGEMRAWEESRRSGQDQHLMLERGLEDKLRENKPRSAELLLSTPVEAHSDPWRWNVKYFIQLFHSLENDEGQDHCEGWRREKYGSAVSKRHPGESGRHCSHIEGGPKISLMGT